MTWNKLTLFCGSEEDYERIDGVLGREGATVFADAPDKAIEFLESFGLTSPDEISCVVMGESLSCFQLLRFLAAMPLDFLGDVIAPSIEGPAFLNSVSPSGGRILYELSRADVAFYFRVRDGLADRHPAARLAAVRQGRMGTTSSSSLGIGLPS